MNKHGIMAFIMGAGNLPIMATHDFIAKDGDLQHFVNGVLRATVPAAGQDDYVSQWPDAADVVSAMRINAPVLDLSRLEDKVSAIADQVKNDVADNATEIDFLRKRLGELTSVSIVEPVIATDGQNMDNVSSGMNSPDSAPAG